jgi:hypothetical protein
MSSGLMICSRCRREVHQDGPKNIANGWRHCVDRTPRCFAGSSEYPASRAEIVGPFCGADTGGQDDDTAKLLESRRVVHPDPVLLPGQFQGTREMERRRRQMVRGAR